MCSIRVLWKAISRKNTADRLTACVSAHETNGNRAFLLIFNEINGSITIASQYSGEIAQLEVCLKHSGHTEHLKCAFNCRR